MTGEEGNGWKEENKKPETRHRVFKRTNPWSCWEMDSTREQWWFWLRWQQRLPPSLPEVLPLLSKAWDFSLCLQMQNFSWTTFPFPPGSHLTLPLYSALIHASWGRLACSLLLYLWQERTQGSSRLLLQSWYRHSCEGCTMHTNTPTHAGLLAALPRARLGRRQEQPPQLQAAGQPSGANQAPSSLPAPAAAWQPHPLQPSY